MKHHPHRDCVAAIGHVTDDRVPSSPGVQPQLMPAPILGSHQQLGHGPSVERPACDNEELRGG